VQQQTSRARTHASLGRPQRALGTAIQEPSDSHPTLAHDRTDAPADADAEDLAQDARDDDCGSESRGRLERHAGISHEEQEDGEKDDETAGRIHVLVLRVIAVVVRRSSFVVVGGWVVGWGWCGVPAAARCAKQSKADAYVPTNRKRDTETRNGKQGRAGGQAGRQACDTRTS
jgi:hypothetical protein